MYHLYSSICVILAGANAVGDGRQATSNALERQQERSLVLGEHVAVHVAVTGDEQVHFLHRVHFKLIKSQLRSLHLRLHLKK